MYSAITGTNHISYSIFSLMKEPHSFQIRSNYANRGRGKHRGEESSYNHNNAQTFNGRKQPCSDIPGKAYPIPM